MLLTFIIETNTIDIYTLSLHDALPIYAGAFWRVVSEHGAVALFTAPTAFRAIKKEDPNGDLLKGRDLQKFRTLFLAGERSEEHTSELQSLAYLVCRLLFEKKNKANILP